MIYFYINLENSINSRSNRLEYCRILDKPGMFSTGFLYCILLLCMSVHLSVIIGDPFRRRSTYKVQLFQCLQFHFKEIKIYSMWLLKRSVL